ncbi:DUF937 domain-containing protein [Hansschlegelia quercus]|uniref:DUF937 domain-containing protein n=1 Tax=Hansschlegelia quercus TaxID=2528245 RepID=A0A4V2JEF1_9HYPH|nr:DUF937 domain-containing protein [Hansschlegelia quercus]TBN55016.1 DUF937 domain-containing protein [Hansschlegelia quercus]
MFDVFEMMRRAQGGQAFDNLARAYGLSPEQMRAAAAAVSPAFAQAFQRRSEGEEAAERLSQMFGAETYARAFDMQSAAFDAAAQGPGDAALSALFGSPDVSRAVAAQASAASGVQAEIIRKVLPVLAGVLIGGFLKASKAPGAAPAADYWRNIAGAPAPFGRNAAQEEAAEPKEAATMMGDMVAEMLNGMFPGVRPTPERPGSGPTPEPESPPAGRGDEDRPEAGGAPFDAFVEGSREWQAENAKAMEKIFDAFWGGAKKGG